MLSNHQNHKQRGFTLLEIIFTVTIVSTMATIGYSYYSQYVVLSQAVEGQNLVMMSGRNLTTMNRNLSCAPAGANVKFQGKTGKLEVTGVFKELIGNTCRTGCTATYTFPGENVDKALANKVIVGDILNDGRVSKSSLTTVDPQYLDSSFIAIPISTVDTCTSVTRPNPSGITLTNGKVVDVSTLPNPIPALDSVYPFPEISTPIFGLPSQTVFDIDLTQPFTLSARVRDTAQYPPSYLCNVWNPTTNRMELNYCYDNPYYYLQNINFYSPELEYINPAHPYSLIKFSDNTQTTMGNFTDINYRDKNGKVVRYVYLNYPHPGTYTENGADNHSLAKKMFDAYPSVTIQRYVVTPAQVSVNQSTGEKTVITPAVWTAIKNPEKLKRFNLDETWIPDQKYRPAYRAILNPEPAVGSTSSLGIGVYDYYATITFNKD